MHVSATFCDVLKSLYYDSNRALQSILQLRRLHRALHNSWKLQILSTNYEAFSTSAKIWFTEITPVLYYLENLQKSKQNNFMFSVQFTNLTNAEINIVVHWKFWRKYGSVLHLFSCKENSQKGDSSFCVHKKSFLLFDRFSYRTSTLEINTLDLSFYCLLFGIKVRSPLF